MLSAVDNPAPAIEASAWINTPQALLLDQFQGKVVVLHAFQMLCPGCVSHGIPQALRIHQQYSDEAVQVIGLHCVFEHHQVMSQEALQVFVSEYRLPFPIAVDRIAEIGPIPKTMQRYHLQGTPSLVLIDKRGHIRLSHFGVLSDLQVGDAIGKLLME